MCKCKFHCETFKDLIERVNVLEIQVATNVKGISKGVTQGLITDAKATQVATDTIASDLVVQRLRGELHTHEDQPQGPHIHPDGQHGGEHTHV